MSLKKTQVWLWGKAKNEDGKHVTHHIPRLCSSLDSHRVKSIALGGKHFLALCEGGTVYSWGENNYGQLGHGHTQNVSSPTLVRSLTLRAALEFLVVVAVEAGNDHSIALMDNGFLFTWGGNHAGQLGRDVGGTKAVNPGVVARLTSEKIVMVGSGSVHCLALTEKGEVYSWGKRANGRIGHGGERERETKEGAGVVRVAKPKKLKIEQIIAVACGWAHSFCLSKDGLVYGFGKGNDGQLGISSPPQDVFVPAPINMKHFGGKKVKEIKGGYLHSAAITVEGELYMWGAGQYGQLGMGDGLSYDFPTKVPSKYSRGKEILDVSLGGFHSCFSTADSVYTCGLGEFGQLGKSDNHSAACPYPVQLFLKEAKGKEEEEGEVGRVISVKCGRWFTSVVTDVSDLSVEKLQQFEREYSTCLGGESDLDTDFEGEEDEEEDEEEEVPVEQEQEQEEDDKKKSLPEKKESKETKRAIHGQLNKSMDGVATRLLKREGREGRRSMSVTQGDVREREKKKEGRAWMGRSFKTKKSEEDILKLLAKNDSLREKYVRQERQRNFQVGLDNQLSQDSDFKKEKKSSPLRWQRGGVKKGEKEEESEERKKEREMELLERGKKETGGVFQIPLGKQHKPPTILINPDAQLLDEEEQEEIEGEEKVEKKEKKEKKEKRESKKEKKEKEEKEEKKEKEGEEKEEKEKEEKEERDEKEENEEKEKELEEKEQKEKETEPQSLDVKTEGEEGKEGMEERKEEDDEETDEETTEDEIESLAKRTSLINVGLGEEEMNRLKNEFFRNGAEVRNRTYLLQLHMDCFVARQAVTWISHNAKVSREEATKIARTWEDSGLFRCVTSDTRQFRDDSAFFRFLVPRGLMDESPNVGRRGSRRESEDFGEGLRKIGGGPHLPQKRANSFSSMSTPLLLSPTLSPPNFSSSYSLPPENPSPRANSYDPNRLIDPPLRVVVEPETPPSSVDDMLDKINSYMSDVIQERINKNADVAPSRWINQRKGLFSVWVKELLPDWDRSGRPPTSISKVWRIGGIPPSLRGSVWMRAIGNGLCITPKLYSLFSKQAELWWERMARVERLEGREEEGKRGKFSSLRMIELDTKKTFAKTLPTYRMDSEQQQNLKQLLTMYMAYRPDIGYVPGMNEVAGVILLFCEPWVAFLCLGNLLNMPLFQGLYRYDWAIASAFIGKYEKYLEINLPSVSKHFKKLGITSEVYLCDWVKSIYGKVLPLSIVCRIWDCFLFEGEAFLIKAAVTVVTTRKQRILGANLERCMEILYSLHLEMDPEMFFTTCYTVKSPPPQ